MTLPVVGLTVEVVAGIIGGGFSTNSGGGGGRSGTTIRSKTYKNVIYIYGKMSSFSHY